jgi:hypothetical protein
MADPPKGARNNHVRSGTKRSFFWQSNPVFLRWPVRFRLRRFGTSSKAELDDLPITAGTAALIRRAIALLT